jgi:hypothetical protein
METSEEMLFSGMGQCTIQFWLTTKELDDYKDTFHLFLKLTPPFKRLIGLLLRDENGNPYTFNSSDEAFSFGRNYVREKLLNEE